MPANTNVHTPMIPIQTVSGNTPNTRGIPEAAAQVFLQGVPVQLTGGFVAIWNGTTVAAGILGISNIFGSNLASNGAGAPPPFTQVGPPIAIQTWGRVINQPLAVNISVGTPTTDGRTLVLTAQSDTIFEGMMDNSAGAVPVDFTPLPSDVGRQMGVTFDTNGTAYVDKGKVTAGTNTVVTIVELSPVDGSIVNGRVRFTFTLAARQLFN